jgi:predicted nucleic acid-binding protein
VALVIDTGVLLAALDESDPDHHVCRELLESVTEPLVVPAPVLVELDYWLRKLASVDVWLTFCEEVSAGAYRVHATDDRLLVAAARLQATYADTPIGFVDAAVAAICEALGEKRVATLDRRHFAVLRIGGEPLRIVPD